MVKMMNKGKYTSFTTIPFPHFLTPKLKWYAALITNYNEWPNHTLILTKRIINSVSGLKEYRSAMNVMRNGLSLLGDKMISDAFDHAMEHTFSAKWNRFTFELGFGEKLGQNDLIPNIVKPKHSSVNHENSFCERVVFRPCLVLLQQRRLSSIYVAWTPIIQDPMVVSSNAYVFNNPLHFYIYRWGKYAMIVNRALFDYILVRWLNLPPNCENLTCLYWYTEPYSWKVLQANQLHDGSTYTKRTKKLSTHNIGHEGFSPIWMLRTSNKTHATGWPSS